MRIIFSYTAGSNIKVGSNAVTVGSNLVLMAKNALIQIYSVDWTDVYNTHNIEHRTEPVSH